MLNMNKYKSEMMYDRGAKNNMAVPESTSISKVQGNAHFGATYKYKLVGRLETGFKWIPIILVKDSNADMIDGFITDSGIYTADITGYKDVSIQIEVLTGESKDVSIGRE